MAEQMRVGFIGLGSMGAGMAARVLQGGYPLTVFNRTRARSAPLVELGASAARTAREAAEASDVLILMLADPSVVRAVLEGPDGALAGLQPGRVIVEMSTVGPADARDEVARAGAHGIRVLHAPVLGPPSAAADGTLTILAGGDGQLLEQLQPLLSTMARSVVPLVGNEQACALKLAANAMLLVPLQAFGEAVALATRWGIPREQVLGFFSENPSVPATVRARIPAMFTPDAPVNFALELGRKDLWLAVAAAYESGAAVPLIANALETYTLAMRDHRSEDIARIVGFLNEMGQTS